ncbi:undecaprenyl/decaprenyl-phosphate alpha-N-acetylglucosaminyl 1-phosphate transferase, partial [Candidatus Peregrinibacteria bacterium]|nr:undecaprenyl/decaprenyl-phosphate alpha-N-acetylglucosaminyl 1-phosphate transferase [Candidatus Peregrinibacteria bacterium]
LIAALAIFSGGKVATAFLVLGIPILDMIWVVVRRTLKGKKFWQGDLLHLHHRLLGINLSERVVVLIYLFVTALFGIFAVTFVTTEQKLFILAALVILMLLLATALVLLPRKKQ